jgi:hypothetical protein
MRECRRKNTENINRVHPLNGYTLTSFSEDFFHTDHKDLKDGYAVRYAVMLRVCVAAKRRNNL